jgi:hypothetical protein
MKKLLYQIPFLLFISGCGSSYNPDNPSSAQFNSEIVCPNSAYRFLILQSNKAEVEASIRQAIEYNQKSNKRTAYTILYLPNNRTTSIYNVTPQELQSQCMIIERPRNIK